MGDQAVVMGTTAAVLCVYFAVALCAAAAVSARLWEWLRAYIILQRMPSPPGRGLLGHLSFFSESHHKTITQWARVYGPIYRIRLANVHVGVERHLLNPLKALSMLKRRMLVLVNAFETFSASMTSAPCNLNPYQSGGL